MTSAKVKLFKHSCVDWDLVPGDWFLPAHWRRSIQSPCCLCIITIHFPLHWITNKKQGGTNSQLESTKMFFIIASADPARYLNCRHVWALGTLERTKRTELQRSTWTRSWSLILTWKQARSLGARSFSAAAPKLWNGLPVELCQATSLDSFKSQLT